MPRRTRPAAGMAEGNRGAKSGPSALGCLAGALIGIGLVVANAAAFSWLTGRGLDLPNEKWVLLGQMLIAGAPFLLLGVAGVRSLLPWAAGLALTLSLWGYALWEGVSYQRHPDGSGANIGLGLILLVSPLFIAAAAFAVHALERRAGRRA
jgi:hypothetical protein